MTESRSAKAAVLWMVAFLIMAGAAVWQRLTGPTHPRRVHAELAGRDVRFRLLRSAVSSEPFLVSVPAPEGVSGVVRFRRFPTSEPFQDVPMRREGGALAAILPTQPPAGKLEYAVVLNAGGREVPVPEDGPVVMRFKGDVPAGVLVPHVVAMFFGMMIGLRAALAAGFSRPEARRYAWVTVVLIGIGGLVLGPIVQKHAFGAYWTGFPFGFDLTDNKTLIAGVAWVWALWRLKGRSSAPASVVSAALVTLVVFAIPHSVWGSEIKWE